MARIRVDPKALQNFATALFVQAGLSPEHAATIAQVQLEADLRGMHSHGMRAVPTYLARIRRGIINPRPNLTVTDLGIGVLVEGDAGPGQVVASRAMTECLRRARRQRVGLAFVRDSNHFGAAGYYAGMALAEDMIGFATTNGNLVLAPWGSVTPTVGNNPIAIAVPAGEEPPILVDVAMSVVAGGKVDLLAAEGEALPEGWWLDAAGQPTRDLLAALSGLGIPLGAPVAGYKGFALAFAMEVLAGALTGARFGREHTLEVENGPLPWNEGHFFLALDPSLTMPLAQFKARVDQMIREVRASQPGPGGTPIHAPGELGWRRREKALQEGVWLPSSVIRGLQNWASELGVTSPLEGIPEE